MRGSRPVNPSSRLKVLSAPRSKPGVFRSYRDLFAGVIVATLAFWGLIAFAAWLSWRFA